MKAKVDRFFNPKDGTYANVPLLPVNVEKFRGKRPFNTNVLIGNWYEDREKFKESSHKPKPFYRIEYPVHVGSVPDTVFRRKILTTQEYRPDRLILEHHDIDDSKQHISSYDEEYQRRGAYGEHSKRVERKWALQENLWLPERSDHPLQSTPTNWGLAEYKRSQSQCFQRQRTLPEISEYNDRFRSHKPKTYLASKLINIPRISRTNSLHNSMSNRPSSQCSRRPLKYDDPIEIDNLCSHRRNEHVPRALFYLGTVATEYSNFNESTINNDIVTSSVDHQENKD